MNRKHGNAVTRVDGLRPADVITSGAIYRGARVSAVDVRGDAVRVWFADGRRTDYPREFRFEIFRADGNR